MVCLTELFNLKGIGLRRHYQMTAKDIPSQNAGCESTIYEGEKQNYSKVQWKLFRNAYPLAFIILWLPAIANRLIEATGHSSTVMQFLQVTRQLVGLANAWTFGWNERVAEQLLEKFSTIDSR